LVEHLKEKEVILSIFRYLEGLLDELRSVGLEILGGIGAGGANLVTITLSISNSFRDQVLSDTSTAELRSDEGLIDVHEDLITFGDKVVLHSSRGQTVGSGINDVGQDSIVLEIDLITRAISMTKLRGNGVRAVDNTT